MAFTELQITEIMKTIVDGLDISDLSITDVYFDFGNYIEIANKLTKENVNNQKYPLFALILDVRETEIENNQVFKGYGFSMIIAYNTEKDYTSQQRRDNIFKPILQPLYRKLIDAIKISTSFLVQNNFVDHEKWDRYFLGSDADPGQNRFNDFVDAIEINFRNLEATNKSNC